MVNGLNIMHRLYQYPETERHIYILLFRPDDTYTITIDGDESKNGKLFEDMQPPLQPPTEVDDPDDTKPEDWVDDATIPDESAVKPDDWDEDAPEYIPDTSVKMPEGWLEDEVSTISDPDAKQPDDWDEEEDGEWQAPIIANPKCTVGCGKWSPPQISNPAYKGKWSPPMIANPAYKGPWSPRKIPNPNLYEVKEPHALAPFDSVGFELWTMQRDLLFDNIVISRSEEAAKEFAQKSFHIRAEIEKASASMDDPDTPLPKDTKADEAPFHMQLLNTATQLCSEYPIYCAAGGIGLLLILVLMTRTSAPKPAREGTPSDEAAAAPEKEDEKEEDKDDDKVRKRKGKGVPKAD